MVYDYSSFQQNKNINYILGLFTIFVLFVGIVVFFRYIDYRWNIWKSPCTKVYDGEILIYYGNSHFYKTYSRGTGTMFQQKSERFILPKIVKEIQTNDLRIETVTCKDL